MNISIERKRTDCVALPKGWQREENLRKTGLSAGKVDVYYYSPTGKKIESKPQLARILGDSIDLSTFDFQAGRIIQNPSTQLLLQHNALKRKLAGTPITTSICGPGPAKHQFDYSRGMRADTSLVPPIRQTASIFKQPVTIHKSQEGEGKVKKDLKHGTQDKPKQLFWEKRLEGLRACDTDGTEIGNIELPKRLKPVGPNVTEGTLLQSIATSLHVSNQPVTGQTAPKQALTTNSGVYVNPEQPLMHLVSISEDDIKRQEERVQYARLRLQEALRG